MDLYYLNQILPLTLAPENYDAGRDRARIERDLIFQAETAMQSLAGVYGAENLEDLILDAPSFSNTEMELFNLAVMVVYDKAKKLRWQEWCEQVQVIRRKNHAFKAPYSNEKSK